jgi:nitroreductase
MALTPEQLAKLQAEWATVNNGIVSGASKLWLEAWYARKAPTVATPGQPVISKTFTNDLAYDNTKPSDYLMRLNARMQATGKKPTETELYNMYQAQDALQKQAVVNPFDTTALQGQIDTARQTENKYDTMALDKYKQQLDAQYATDSSRLQSQGKDQQKASQWVYSFSGFGRSTAAAQDMERIQGNTNAAINQLDLARQTAIALKDAELRWADSAELQALNKQMEAYQKAANDRQVESIKSTAEANQKTGASYIESINNLMTAANASGLDINKAGFENAALALKGMTDKQKKEYLATLSPEEALLLQGLSNAGTGEAPEVKNMWTTKNPNWVQWNGKERTPISAAQAARVGGGSGWASAWVSTWGITATSILNDPRLSKSVWLLWSSLARVPWTDAFDFKKEVDNYINNLVLPKMKFLKGSMSDKDIVFIKWAATALDTGMSEAQFRKTLQDMGATLAKYDDNWNPIAGVTNTWTTPAPSAPSPKLSSIRDSL